MKGEKSMLRLPDGKWWLVPHMAESMQITAEEQATLSDLYFEMRREMIAAKSGLQTQMLELEILFDREPFDKNNCQTQYMKVQQARTQLAAKRFEFVTEVRQLLGAQRFRQLERQFRQAKKKYLQTRRAPKRGKTQ